jgi:hypothetical protein
LPLCLLAACASGPSPLGPSGAPVVAQVLGHPVRANGPDEVQYLILRELTDRFAAERGIAVSQAEVDAWLARQRQVLAADPNVRLVADSAEEQAARGRFRILDAAYEREFWRAWTDDTRWHFLPAGSKVVDRAFDVPAAPR